VSFSLDQVRETFTADITRLLGRIEEAAAAALSSHEAAVRPAFVTLGESGHAIAGTTALVGVSSLNASARLLEETARAGEESLRQAAWHAERARLLAGVCADGAKQMRQMLTLELAARSAEADKLARSLESYVQSAVGAVPGDPEEPVEPLAADPEFAVPEAPPEFEFEEAEQDPPTIDLRQDDQAEEFAFGDSVIEGGEPTYGDELLEVFREEAQATLGPLASRLTALRQTPSDLTLAAELERQYHTLKGAAATVGLAEVSAAAAHICERLDGLLEERVAGSVALVDEIAVETSALLALAGLPPLPPPPREAPEEPARREAGGLFIEECRDLHHQAATLLRGLPRARDAERAALRESLGRVAHRLKGSALIVGEREIAEAAQGLQAVLESDGDPEEAGALVLAAADSFLARNTPADRVREPVQITSEGELWEAFQLECNEILEGVERELLALEESAQPKTNLEALMRLVHTLKGVVNTVGLNPTGQLLHAVEDFLETLLAAPILPPMRSVASLLVEVRDAVTRNFRQAADGSVEVFLPRIAARISRLLGAQAAPASTLVQSREEGASIHSLESARSRRSQRSADPSRGGGDGMERRFIRVATERLDNLMNLAGELVVSRSRLIARAVSLRDIQRELARGSRRLLESVEGFREEHEFSKLDGRRVRRSVAGWGGFGELELDRYEDVHVLSRTLTEITGDFDEMNGQLARGLASLSDDSDSFDKLVSGIQSEVTRARMVPLEVLFTRLKFPVRDAATRDAKEVRVETVGADVALDKTIADALLQPMLHLVRNAVSHGIERPATREEKRKPRTGTITLVARQHAGQIGIEVSDDGGGLDLEALRARGVAMGLIGADVAPSDPAVRELVFQAGLSTSAQAGALSGRGVGCDVVRRAVERLGGSIRVESEAGRGTTFLITLPVSLAITKALLVRAGGRSYAVPLHFAERIVDVADSTFVESANVRRIKISDQLLPVSTVTQQFGDQRGEPGRAVLLLRLGDHRLALEVDAVTGQEEVVVKSLGPFLTGHPLFAGVTIRGSGDLVLILDVAGLIQRTQRAVAPRARAGKKLEPMAVKRAPAPVAASRLKVLFIDDSLSVRKFAEMTLKALGVDVTLAIDGVDGMNKIRSGGFDLVFTDLEMPRMHGFELIGELRFLPAYKNLPIIVVTSRSGQKHQQQARALGATDYLTKPFNAQMLDTALKRWGRRADAQEKDAP
jgi:chemosensory pili system protein ChpA (sensor histidine kinase/response regulator)